MTGSKRYDFLVEKMICRVFIAFMLVFFVAGPVYAGTALPDAIDETQPDGQVIRIRIRGDEFQGWTELEDTGHTILRNPTTGYWEYAERAGNGFLKRSGIRVQLKGKNVPARIPRSLKPPRNTQMESWLQESVQANYQLRLAGGQGVSPTGPQAGPGDWVPAPLSGQKKVLIILVQFANRTLTTTASGWSGTTFDSTTGALSMANYFSDNSFGAMTIVPSSHSQSENPPGIITVTVSDSHPNSGSTFSYHTETTILNHALAEANTNFNFAAADTNGNGIIEQSELTLYFIYAGYEASGSSNTPNIWAHAWGGTGVSVAGKSVRNWAISGELNNSGAQHPMGVIAHEMGHALCGLPDLYDISGQNQAMGNFSLMAGGSWGANASPNQDYGTTPTALDAWSREYLGWITPVTPLAGGSISLAHALTSSASSAIKLVNTDVSSTEYFLVEHRRPASWDLGLRRLLPQGVNWQGGLLITHIDATAGTAGYNNINSYTANGGRQGVVPVQASTASCNMLSVGSNCRGHATTLFYSGNNASWTPATTPDSDYYSGAATSFSLTSISSPGVTMTANLSFAPPAPVVVAATLPSPTGFTANWNASAGATGYRLDVSTDSGFTAWVAGYSDRDVGNVTSHAVSGLAPGTTYHYRVRAVNASGTSQSSGTISQVTLPDAPTALAATSVTETGFTANWNASAGAGGYRLDVAEDSGFTTFVTGYSDRNVGTLTSYAVSGLSGARPYYYRVRALNGAGASASSLTISLTTPGRAMLAVAMGPDPINSSEIRLLDGSLNVVRTFVAFDRAAVGYGARVAMGDVDGDGQSDVIVAKGGGIENNSEVKAFDLSGKPLTGANIIPFSSSFRLGARVAAGDFDGDQQDEIIVGTGEGPALVRVFHYDAAAGRLVDTGVVLNAFDAGADGVNVAASDVDGDAVPELITTPASKRVSPAIRVWKIETGGGMGHWTASLYTAFSPAYVLQSASGGGASAGGNGGSLFAVATGASGGQFEVYTDAPVYDCVTDGMIDGLFRQRHGIEVSAGDADGDGLEEVVVTFGANPAADSRIMVYRRDCQLKSSRAEVFPGALFGASTAIR